MNDQWSSDRLRRRGGAKRPTSLALFGLMVSVLVVGLLASYQHSSAAPTSGPSARPASGTVSLTKTVSANSVRQGGNIQYTVTIQNGMTGTIHISSFADLYSQSATDITTNPTSPGWISCSDPASGSNLSCSNGSIAAGQTQRISFSATVHANATPGDIATDLANIVFRLDGDNSDRTAFSSGVSVTITAAVPPTNTAVPPAPTNTAVLAAPTNTASLQRPTLPPAPTSTPIPIVPTAIPNAHGGGGVSGSNTGGGHQRGEGPTPTTPPAPPAPIGTILGVITRGAGPAANVPITLHLKSGDGDTQVATANTDANGQYSFSGMPATPAGAGYYVYFASNQAGDLAQWFTYPAAYSGGQLIKLPTFDIADLTLPNQSKGDVSGRVAFSINRRYASETYLLRFAPWNRPGSTTLDAGSLGNGNSLTLDTTLLPPNRYQGIVKVVDSTAGYGFANSHFSLTVGGPIVIITPGVGGNGVLKLSLTANTTRSVPGTTLIYGIAVANNSDATLTNIVITFPLVAGQTLDIFNTKTTVGSIKATGNTVMATIPALNGHQGAAITIYIAISADAGNVLTNQARAVYDQSSTALPSNSVSVTVTGGSGRPAPAPATTPTGGPHLPTTGGEFPLWLLFLSLGLVGVIAAVRVIRVRRAA